jgi:hypothetical protein
LASRWHFDILIGYKIFFWTWTFSLGIQA